MGRAEVAIPIRDIQYVNGIRIETVVGKPPQTFLGELSDTAYHEAEHSVIAEERGVPVIRASIQPSGNSLGQTELARPDATAAMAPHANGRNGTGFDRMIVRYYLREDENSAMAAARGILLRTKEEIKEVAHDLDTQKVLTGPEIRSAMKRSRERKEKKPPEITLFTKDSDGIETIIDHPKTSGNTVFVEEKILTQNTSLNNS